MFHNYFKTAIRNLWRRRGFTALNILALTIGIVAYLLIFQYVKYERDYDKISPHTDRLWRAFNETVTNGQVTTQDGNTHSIIGPALKADQPGVVDYFRMYNRNAGDVVFFRNNQPVKIKHGWMTDPGFLRIFPQRFIEGNPATCLVEPWKMVITESAARQLFPSGKAMGKLLQVPGGPFSGTYQVEGIVADPPQNTHLKFNLLASYATRYAKGHKDGWDSYWDYNYFLLAKDADIEPIREQLAAYSELHLREQGIRLNMQPFESIHLYSNLTYEIEPNGSARTVYFLTLVALCILAIAFVNYLNMTTACASERAKEVGMRKVAGANRVQLFFQFLLEGLLLNGLSIVLAIAIMVKVLPMFGNLVGKPLDLHAFDSRFWVNAAGIFSVAMLAACAFPAMVLTRFSPMVVLRGVFVPFNMKIGADWFRKSLVVFQFTCSTILIVGLMVVSRQLNFLQNHDKGLSLKEIVSVKLPETDWRQDSINRVRMRGFKNEIARLSGIQSVAASEIVPGLGIQSISGTSSGLVLANKPGSILPGTIYFIPAEPAFYQTFGIRFLAGKPFVAPDERTGDQHVIINEALLKLLGIPAPQDAIGTELAYVPGNDGYRMKIEGVVADFNIESLKEPARPTLYFCQPDVRNGFISFKVHTGQTKLLLASLEQVWKKYYPETPFEYWFLDEQFGRLYAAETQLKRVFSLFAGLAVFIACLGLYGLARYTATRRRKEIGIRRTLGATVSGISIMLSKDFLKLVLIAIMLATPVSYFLLQNWLEDFAYRTQVSWWIFCLSGLFAFGIALFAISFQAIKASVTNPVKSLRTE